MNHVSQTASPFRACTLPPSTQPHRGGPAALNHSSSRTPPASSALLLSLGIFPVLVCLGDRSRPCRCHLPLHSGRLSCASCGVRQAISTHVTRWLTNLSSPRLDVLQVRLHPGLLPSLLRWTVPGGPMVAACGSRATCSLVGFIFKLYTQ